MAKGGSNLTLLCACGAPLLGYAPAPGIAGSILSDGVQGADGCTKIFNACQDLSEVLNQELCTCVAGATSEKGKRKHVGAGIKHACMPEAHKNMWSI